MKNIPTWIVKALKKEVVTCHYCKEVFSDNAIMAVGIRKGQGVKAKEFLFVELFCSKCKKVTLFELTEMYLEEFACEILGIDENLDTEELFEMLESELENHAQEEKDKPKSSKKRIAPIKKSKITLKELKDSAEFLNSINSHDDFLVELGMTPEEIDKYKPEKRKKKDNE
ncbi:MAG TPA: hypothetical protein VMZ91_14800 [Candidatus Paceibacterota bacterium]|nr:hypothetical protein [Candidatus Paceibacterota bacterium]